MAELITISGLRQMVAKKSKGEHIPQRELEALENYMKRLKATIESQHDLCCEECVTKAVWLEALPSYEFITGKQYEI